MYNITFQEKPFVQIANLLIDNLKIKYYNNELYVYNNGLYINDISILEREILKLNPNTTKHFRNEILEYIRIKKSEDNTEISKKYINFKNFLFDIENKQIISHTPDVFTINQINAEYITNEYINNDVDSFLNDITSNNPNRKETILQIIGYCMTSNTEFQKAFIFYGPTAGNGKSTLIDIISHLIGKSNICHVSIHDLQRGRFYASEMKNKLLNTVSELPRTNLDTVELFKGTITGDELAVEEKHKSRYTIKPYSKHIFSANELPSVEDTTNGFYRRLNILKFDAHFTDEAQKNFKIEKLLNTNAINYLAKISLQAYLKLLDTRLFANEDESNELINIYKSKNNPIFSYLNSNHFKTFIANNYIFPRYQIYEEYKKYCSNYLGVEYTGKIAFYNKIRESNLFEEIIIHGTDCFKYKAI